MMRRWVGWGLGAASCVSAGTPDEFATSLAEAQCDQLERCLLGLYEATFSSEEDCISDTTDEIDGANDAYTEADCTFQPDEAADCVRRVRGLDCDEIVQGRDQQACDLVWSCEDPYVTLPTNREER